MKAFSLALYLKKISLELGVGFLLLFFSATFFTKSFAAPLANEGSIYQCACVLSAGKCLDFESVEGLLEEAMKSSHPALVELAEVIAEGVRFTGEYEKRGDREALHWELGQMVLNLRELISFYAEGFEAGEIRELADQYRAQIRSRLTNLEQKTAKSKREPKMVGARYFPVPGVDQPKTSLFVAGNPEQFSRWIRSLGGEERKAVWSRLTSISSNTHFGDVEVTWAPTHLSSATIYELRMHPGSGPRIYYLQKNGSVIILFYGLKSKGKKHQNQSIKRAGKIADEFLAVQAGAE